MPQGQAVDVRKRQFVVQLKEYFDQERRQGPTVSTQDAVGRVAQALGLGKRTVKEILSTYHKAGQVAVPALESKGKPPYRIQPALETVIRQRIRARRRARRRTGGALVPRARPGKRRAGPPARGTRALSALGRPSQGCAVGR